METDITPTPYDIREELSKLNIDFRFTTLGHETSRTSIYKCRFHKTAATTHNDMEFAIEILADYLKTNPTLWELDLSSNDLTTGQVETLAQAVDSQPYLRRLSLANNNLTEDTASSLLAMCETNTTLATLDLSNNPRLGHSFCNRVQYFNLRNGVIQDHLLRKNAEVDDEDGIRIRKNACEDFESNIPEGFDTLSDEEQREVIINTCQLAYGHLQKSDLIDSKDKLDPFLRESLAKINPKVNGAPKNSGNSSWCVIEAARVILLGVEGEEIPANWNQNSSNYCPIEEFVHSKYPYKTIDNVSRNDFFNSLDAHLNNNELMIVDMEDEYSIIIYRNNSGGFFLIDPDRQVIASLRCPADFTQPIFDEEAREVMMYDYFTSVGLAVHNLPPLPEHRPFGVAGVMDIDNDLEISVTMCVLNQKMIRDYPLPEYSSVNRDNVGEGRNHKLVEYLDLEESESLSKHELHPNLVASLKKINPRMIDGALNNSWFIIEAARVIFLGIEAQKIPDPSNNISDLCPIESLVFSVHGDESVDGMTRDEFFNLLEDRLKHNELMIVTLEDYPCFIIHRNNNGVLFLIDPMMQVIAPLNSHTDFTQEHCDGDNLFMYDYLAGIGYHPDEKLDINFMVNLDFCVLSVEMIRSKPLPEYSTVNHYYDTHEVTDDAYGRLLAHHSRVTDRALVELATSIEESSETCSSTYASLVTGALPVLAEAAGVCDDDSTEELNSNNGPEVKERIEQDLGSVGSLGRLS